MYDIRNFFAPYIQGPGLSVTIEQGYIQVGGLSLFVPRTIVSLAANATTYIYLDSSGTISTSNSGFPAGSDYPIAVVVTGTSSVITLTDSRPDVAAGGGGGTGGVAIAPGGNTAGVAATISTGTVILAGGNNITVSQNGQTLSIVGNAGSGSGQFSAGISGGNTSGVTGTVSNQVVLAGGNNITLSGSTNPSGMSITISGSNQSIQTQGSVLINGSSGQIVLTAGPNISLQQNLSTITISASNQSVQTQNCVDISLAGNTSGVLALISTGTAILSGGTNITLSQNGQTIEIDAATQTVQTQNCVDISIDGNTTGTAALVSSGTLVLSGGNNVTLSQHGQTIEIDAAGGGGGVTISNWWALSPGVPIVAGNNIQTNQPIGSIFIWPMQLPNFASASAAQCYISMSLSSSSNSSFAATLSVAMAIYTRSASTFNTISSTIGTFAFTNTTQNSLNFLSGIRQFRFPMNVNATPGEYWMGMSISSATLNANWATFSIMAVRHFPAVAANFSGTLGEPNPAPNSVQYMPGFGMFSTTTSAFPSIGLSDINGAQTQWQIVPIVQFINFSA